MAVHAATRQWCFDAVMLDEALEAWHQARRPRDRSARAAVDAQSELILRFLHSDVARTHGLMEPLAEASGAARR